MRPPGEFRFGLLLICLFGTLLIPPYFSSSGFFSRIWAGVFTGSLLAAVYAVGGRRQVMLPGSILMFAAVISLWVGEINEVSRLSAAIAVVDSLTTIAFLGFITFHLARYVLVTRRVTTNLIFASLCLYMLLGFLWAAIYGCIFQVYDNAFNFATLDAQALFHGSMKMEYFVYFSFVTLSTLGYGDITPVHQVAQSWATMEAMVGQFYIAVVLARLVSLHASAGVRE